MATIRQPIPFITYSEYQAMLSEFPNEEPGLPTFWTKNRIGEVFFFPAIPEEDRHLVQPGGPTGFQHVLNDMPADYAYGPDVTIEE